MLKVIKNENEVNDKLLVPDWNLWGNMILSNTSMFIGYNYNPNIKLVIPMSFLEETASKTPYWYPIPWYLYILIQVYCKYRFWLDLADSYFNLIYNPLSFIAIGLDIIKHHHQYQWRHSKFQHDFVCMNVRMYSSINCVIVTLQTDLLPLIVTKPPVVVNPYITFIILIIIFYGIQQTWVRHDIDCMETIYNLDIVNRNSDFFHNVHLWNFIIVISNIYKIQYKNKKINFVCNMGSSSYSDILLVQHWPRSPIHSLTVVVLLNLLIESVDVVFELLWKIDC